MMLFTRLWNMTSTSPDFKPLRVLKPAITKCASMVDWVPRYRQQRTWITSLFLKSYHQHNFTLQHVLSVEMHPWPIINDSCWSLRAIRMKTFMDLVNNSLMDHLKDTKFPLWSGKCIWMHDDDMVLTTTTVFQRERGHGRGGPQVCLCNNYSGIWLNHDRHPLSSILQSALSKDTLVVMMSIAVRLYRFHNTSHRIDVVYFSRHPSIQASILLNQIVSPCALTLVKWQVK